jgi:hypothetical protein
MGQLSPNFTLEELTASATATRLGIDNTPTQAVIDALTGLCTIALEPARALWGVPVHIDSSFRCKVLNDDVHGVSTSEHLFGRAADCIPQGINLREAFDTIRLSDIPYDQLIIEENEWIHIGMAAEGVTPRHEAMIAVGTPGHWSYQLVTT